MKTITFCSFKGGTAKTSSALHIGVCLAKFHAKKVLLIDFDPQANLSIGLGFGSDNPDTAVPVLQGSCSIQDVIKNTSVDGLSLIPSNTFLDGVERTAQLCGNPYAHELLRESLKDVENDYDFCIIDTSPSLGWLTQSAFFASQYGVICCTPEAYSVLALRRLRDFFKSVQRHHDIQALGVILSLWDERGAVNTELLNEIEKSFPDKTLQAKIRRDISVSRAALHGKSVFDFDPSSRVAQDYKELTSELIQRFDVNSGGIPPANLFMKTEQTSVKV